MIKTLIYDCEIKNCIPNEGEYNDPDLKYCGGWDDFESMGISCIGVYTYWDDIHHIFLEDNLAEFQALTREADEVIGFNSVAFDDNLCKANGIEVTTTYDLLREIRVATGQPPDYEKGVTRGGYSLDNLCRANLQVTKSASGATAPILYQQGKIGQLTSYCIRDIELTRKIFELGLAGKLKDPTTYEEISIRNSEINHYLQNFFETWELREELITEAKKVRKLSEEVQKLKEKLEEERFQHRVNLTALNLMLANIEDDSVPIRYIVIDLLNKVNRVLGF